MTGRLCPPCAWKPTGRAAGPSGRIVADLRRTLAALEGGAQVRTIVFHPGFPVDIRHNAKIERGALGEWARRRLAAKSPAAQAAEERA